MSQAAKGGLWRDDLMQETKQGQAWRIEKQVGPVEDYLPFFPDQESGRAGGILSAGDDVIIADAELLLPGDQFRQHVVLGLASASGEEMWRDAAPSPAGSATVDARGDVFVARTDRVGRTELVRLEVRKLARATGRELWRYTEERAAPALGSALAVDPRP